MGSPQTNQLAALALVDSDQTVVDQTGEQPAGPRDFHFAVTWVTLFAHLDLVESTGPRTRPEAAPTRALVPIVAGPPRDLPAPLEAGAAAWEMVVPKMIRTGTGTFSPAEHSGQSPAKTSEAS